MNKKQASDYLGFTVKNLERLMAEKKIEFKHVKGKFGKEVAFDLEALDNYKASLETSEVVVSPVVIKDDSSINTLANHSKVNPNSLANLTKHTSSKDSMLVSTKDIATILQKLTQNLEKQNQQLTVPLDRKLTLSLVEASQLAGLSIDYLRKAIQQGELKAHKRGKGWNIKRTDLEMYVESM